MVVVAAAAAAAAAVVIGALLLFSDIHPFLIRTNSGYLSLFERGA